MYVDSRFISLQVLSNHSVTLSHSLSFSEANLHAIRYVKKEKKWKLN